MRSDRFADWTRRTRATRTVRKRGVRQRRLLAACGVVLVLFSLAWVFMDLRTAGNADVAAAPEKETLRLTVPRMKRVDNVPVYTAASSNTAALDAGVIRLKGTGLPWEEEANVYIAGHRLGYPNTGSFLVFYDLHRLQRGDRVVLRDARGRRYVYRVFKKFVVNPDQTSVTKPMENRNIVSLQACTLPDYSKRLIVQAELANVTAPPAQQASSS